MLPVYGEYFGLITQPFSVSPDPRFLYASPTHKEALAELSYGIRARRGFVVLTGEVGTGKTTLIRSMLQDLDDGRTRTAFIFTVIGGFRELLRCVCDDFGLTSAENGPREAYDYLTVFNNFLLAAYQKGDNVALIIDEAQNLSQEVLEGVRVLSNFETAEEKLLQILLVGQPELDARLNETGMRQLKQRIALRCHLSPLSFAECREYIAGRLEIAGGAASIIAESAVEAIYSYSCGVPRLINILCDNGLLSAYALSEKYVTGAMIEEIARSLHISAQAHRAAAPLAEANVKVQPKLAPEAEEKSGKTAAEMTNFSEPSSAEKPSAANGGANGATEKPAEREHRLFPKPTLPPRSEAPKAAPAVEAEDAAPPIAEPERIPEAPAVEEAGASHAVPPRSFERMIAALTEAMGPMAPLVLGDHVSAMGESPDDFPKRKFRMLVESTSGEILSDSLKQRYRNVMLEEVRAIGAFWEEP
jgi:general secretion pathway protein A